MEIREFSSRDRESFLNAIQAGMGDGEHAYLILDGALLANNTSLPPFPKDKEFLLKNTPFERLMSDGPLAFELDVHSPWLPWAVSTAQREAVCLISSPLPRQELFSHLRHLTGALTEEGSNALLFRFHDPRNMAILLRSFTEEERRLFLGPIKKLFWFTAAPGLGGAVPDRPRWLGIENQALSTTMLTGPWLLSAASLAALQHHMEPQIVGEVIERLSNFQDINDELRRLGKEKAHAVARMAVHDGIEHKVTNVNEYSQRAKWIIRFGTTFDSDPQYPWVSMNPDKESPEERWNRFHMMADETFDAIYTDNYRSYEYFTKRLWLHRREYRLFSRPRSKEDIAECLARLWPERFEAFDQSGIMLMIERARRDAQALELEMPHGWSLLSGLYFICGIDALVSAIRYPWIVKVREEMLQQPPRVRSSWLFHKLCRRINAMHHPYRLSKAKDRRLFRVFALKRSLTRVIELELHDIKEYTNMYSFYTLLYPEQISRLSNKRCKKFVQDSIECAKRIGIKYNVYAIAPLIGFFSFSFFARLQKYNIELFEKQFLDMFMARIGLLKVEVERREEYLLAEIKKQCARELRRSDPEWPDVDVYESIFTYEVSNV